MRSLDDKRVIVVGASGGLGTEISRALATRRTRLVLVSRHRERLSALGLGGVLVEQDLTERDAGRKIVDAAVAAYGGVDGIVNVAGEVAFGPLSECSDEALERMFAVHVFGPLRLIRAALPHMPKGGFVANVSAITAEAPTAGMVAYSASKAALTAADRALARELHRAGISVVDLRPPHLQTDLSRHPIEGHAPRLSSGLSPKDAAERILRALENEEREVGSRQFVEQSPPPQ